MGPIYHLLDRKWWMVGTLCRLFFGGLRESLLSLNIYRHYIEFSTFVFLRVFFFSAGKRMVSFWKFFVAHKKSIPSSYMTNNRGLDSDEEEKLGHPTTDHVKLGWIRGSVINGFSGGKSWPPICLEKKCIQKNYNKGNFRPTYIGQLSAYNRFHLLRVKV